MKYKKKLVKMIKEAMNKKGTYQSEFCNKHKLCKIKFCRVLKGRGVFTLKETVLIFKGLDIPLNELYLIDFNK